MGIPGAVPTHPATRLRAARRTPEAPSEAGPEPSCREGGVVGAGSGDYRVFGGGVGSQDHPAGPVSPLQGPSLSWDPRNAASGPKGRDLTSFY